VSSAGARCHVGPVFAALIADSKTPVSAFQKSDGRGFFLLLESAEKNEESGRFSFLGIDSRLIIQSYGRSISISEEDHNHRGTAEGEIMGLMPSRDYRMNRADFLYHLVVFVEREGLGAIGACQLRMIVHFDHQSVGSDSNSGAGQRPHHIAFASPV